MAQVSLAKKILNSFYAVGSVGMVVGGIAWATSESKTIDGCDQDRDGSMLVRYSTGEVVNLGYNSPWKISSNDRTCYIASSAGPEMIKPRLNLK